MTQKFAAAALSGLLLIGISSQATATTYEDRMAVETVQVTVSCYRGPTSDVIWDRPNPVFIDSLVSVGYSFSEARAIGERLCRDPSIVNRPDAASQLMHQIIAENPPQS